MNPSQPTKSAFEEPSGKPLSDEQVTEMVSTRNNNILSKQSSQEAFESLALVLFEQYRKKKQEELTGNE